MRVLGIDPALVNVGYCVLTSLLPGKSGKVKMFTLKAGEGLPQFIKIDGQVKALRRVIDRFEPTHVGIEQPYVQSFGGRGAGGHQSANMWAVYSLMLSVIREHQIPVVMFNITQLHSLIWRKRGLTKAEIIERAKQDLGDSSLTLSEHAADAYWIAKHAATFWHMMETGDEGHLNADQRDIFLGKNPVKGGYNGVKWREGDFWFNFRNDRWKEISDLQIPFSKEDYGTQRSSDSPPEGHEGGTGV